MIFSDIFWDFEGSERFEEGGPVWENEVGGERNNVGKEARSFNCGRAGGLPGRLEKIQGGMPSESQQIKGGHDHRQKLFAMAEVVGEFVAMVF